MGNEGIYQAINHKWFQDYDWDALRSEEIHPQFIPPSNNNNFDYNHVNNPIWKDQVQVDQKMNMVNNKEIQDQFKDYYFDFRTLKPKDPPKIYLNSEVSMKLEYTTEGN